MICDAMAKMIQTSGHTVFTSNSGAEAIESYKKRWKDIDLVILDLVMPDRSAADVFTRLHAINPELKVLLASGYSIDGEAQKILNLGAAAFIQKPFSIAELIQKIDDIV